MDTRRFVIDVDTGIDDAALIAYLAAEPTAAIVAAGSTHGNCPPDVAARNTLRVLEICGLDRVPVAEGAPSPSPDPHRASHVHGHDGLADLGLPEPRGAVSGESAVDQLLRLSTEQPGELDLLAVGAMTNLGLALQRDPGVLRRFRSVTILGGYARRPRPGDLVTIDANIKADPGAADILFAADAPLTVVPIDTTNHSEITDAQIDQLRAATTPHGAFIWRILPFYFNFYQPILGGHWSARMHDPLTAAVVLHPDLITETVHRPLDIVAIDGVLSGVGREDAAGADQPSRPAARIVAAVDQQRYLDRWVDALVTPLGELSPGP